MQMSLVELTEKTVVLRNISFYGEQIIIKLSYIRIETINRRESYE